MSYFPGLHAQCTHEHALEVTVILALIALLTFAFSLGKIWALGLRLGVSPWICPLVGPAGELWHRGQQGRS